MQKKVIKITLDYQYHSEKPGTKYTIDGERFYNRGQFVQILKVYELYGRIEKADKVPFDKGSDIPELNESVKSHKATLTSMNLGADFDTIFEEFFKRVASSQFSWLDIVDDELISYTMNTDEFKEFTRLFGEFEKGRKVIRYRQKKAMIKWLEDSIL